jgi:hypothetical protein
MKAYVIKKGPRYLTANKETFSKNYPCIFSNLKEAEEEIYKGDLDTVKEHIVKIDFNFTEVGKIKTPKTPKTMYRGHS